MYLLYYMCRLYIFESYVRWPAKNSRRREDEREKKDFKTNYNIIVSYNYNIMLYVLPIYSWGYAVYASTYRKRAIHLVVVLDPNRIRAIGIDPYYYNTIV